MVAKRQIKLLLALFLGISIFTGCSKNGEKVSSLKDKKIIKIGITQIVEHPALDSTRKGFLEGLKAKGYEEGKNIKIDYQNAQGDMQTNQSIAQNFVSNKEDMIFAIGTPSAQAAFNATKNIPIVITAVTDPVKSGLVKSMEKPETNVTGTSDRIPMEEQFKLLKKLIPNAKSIGIIYNTSESNSEIQIDEAKEIGTKFGLEVTTVGITNVNEIPQGLNSILNKIDVLYLITDNTVASAIPLLVNDCYSKNVPIIGAEKAHVVSGAVATIGIDYYKLGLQTAEEAIKIINGNNIEENPISTLKNLQLVINEDAVSKLKVKVPKDILDKSEKVKGGVK
ncbi:putative ABC transport system substrate-binding protein [Clostridium tetanomorphum]|uniref:ABC transporter substrate-binding protein n=1 Tax=Clostridium tetanomorphum TaxID=1553 RepID=A0A923J1Q4_CLOTT|nr:ABC transporter substrate-binding protein [Clostridium tetanomorphum]KAJ52492.1 ABC transporter substrate-binding protein [Clostridium tetanomorphum DSM 665]MBC2399476.1 ABC transporter substrate-binding protein [Clostridium tetanomorphum]MBP1864171.1 putative ABC transport system substrate-binding protein [Clostridium tetanomorphum]NRS84584.1 putative ABC transport system substrate-binding protein [Clostridium tetanomorphum]NRZ97798.1 putative ABC transport system substrate-binding protein